MLYLFLEILFLISSIYLKNAFEKDACFLVISLEHPQTL